MTALANLKRLAEIKERLRPYHAYKAAALPQHILDIKWLIAEFEQRERKVERLIAATQTALPYLGDQPERFALRKAVADLQADSPPPIARDPIPDTGGEDQMVSVEHLTELLDAFQNADFDSKVRAMVDLDNALRNAAPELLAQQKEVEDAHAELDAEGVSRSSYGGPFGDIKYEERTLSLTGRIHILAERAKREALRALDATEDEACS